MKVAVFGAAGRTGRHVVEQGLARGHEVTAFVRDPTEIRIEHEWLQVVQGDARDTEAVPRAVADRDAVISVLALSAADREPEHSEATRTVVEAAGRSGVRRLVVTANNDVFTDREVTGEFAAHAREHRRNRETVKASALDWTIGAAPFVTGDPPAGSFEAVLDATAPGKRIGAADFATFALDALEREDWVRHIVGVSAVLAVDAG